MALIVWTNAFSVKVEEIDSQHKQLVNILNNLYDVSLEKKDTREVGALFKELANYTVFHFNHEEALMRKAGYPDFDNHKKNHANIVAKVTSLINQYESGNSAVLNEAIDFLKSWLTNHIQITDMDYSSYMNNQGIK